jgi:deoxyribodipyrimidine photo-lyase
MVLEKRLASDPTLVWFRQDLRVSDQAAVAAAAAEGPVVALYVLDDEAAGHWAIGGAQRWWLHHSLEVLGKALDARDVPLILRRGDAVREVAKVASEAGAARVHAIRHYEPWWKAAEEAVGKEVDLCLHDGNQLAPPECILTKQNTRFRMFTPFWRALKEQMPPAQPQPAPRALKGLNRRIASDTLQDWALLPTKPDWSTGFSEWEPGEEGARTALDRFFDHVAGYADTHNLMSEEDGTSRLSPHLHFGEISPATVGHKAARASRAKAEPFLREVEWRDFTTNVIDIIPDYADANGRNVYDKLRWRTGNAADRDFDAWTKGRTGYPIVDAGMRQLWSTGWMHNRVRMITASFLIKHLLIDWQRGERWFWDTLVDADYGNNSVNWQWVAGTGIDSNPFGRIMAPLVQSEKFDAGDYIRRWVPELARLDAAAIHDPHGSGAAPSDYPAPLIGHREARARALAAAAVIKS